MSEQSIPVTVLSGTLGAGKTTTLNHLLAESDQALAVLVNDMGAVNVDADRVAEASDISTEDEKLIELSNGCICCELRGDLLEAIDQLTQSRSEPFDAIVVESTGVAEPLPVAQTLTLGFDQSDLDPTEFYEETGMEPLSNCHLDTTVTVVDAHQFDEAMRSEQVLDDDGTDKHLGDLLIEQVEFCDVLLVNKCDLVDAETLTELEATLRKLQPRAEIVRTTHGEVSPETVIDTGRFDFEEASQSAGWLKELREPHASAEEEHGINSVIFGARRPFHPERFADFLDSLPTEIIRAKGHFWLAGRDERALMMNVAGQSIRIEPGGQWVAALDEETRAEQFDAYPELEEIWDEQVGDRSIQLVLIGTGVDETVSEQLEQCLLTDDERAEGAPFDDPFPAFELEEQAPETETEQAEEVGLAD